MKSMTAPQRAIVRRFAALVVLIGVCLWAGMALGQQIDATHKYAWSENSGWQNFRATHAQASVFSGHLEGYVWAENIGWIRLGTHTSGGTHTYANTSNTNYGVNRTGNTLSGYAWSETVGWINFNPTNGGVSINPSTGDFSGYAWGENIGWIKLAGTAQNSTAYKVKLAGTAPTVTTQSVSDVGTTTATGHGNITSLGVPNPTAHGVCWATTPNPTTDDNCDDKGAASATGAFTANITGLTAGTSYRVRAFATNDAGTAYGHDNIFTTPAAYTLTVTNGTGSGQHAAGAVVNIQANAPDEGKVFDKWTGDTAHVANVNSAATRVTMPTGNVSVTANYKDAPPDTYALTVTSGTGTGTYFAGAVVSIAANVPGAGNIFSAWTGSTTHVANVNNPNTTVTMPAQNIAVDATYKEQPVTDRTLNVIGGSGGGQYKEGAVANIAAFPQEGKVFENWTGDTANVANVNIPNTTVIMPGQNITVTANFKDRPAQNFNLNVTSGEGGGSYPAGRVVRVTANDPPANRIFDIWTGNTARLTDVNSPDTTITMPDANVTITATYRDKPNDPFNLTVNHGTGGGLHFAGTNPEIKAEIPGEQIFDKWTGQTGRVANVNLPDTTVTMPASDVEVTATFMASGGTFTYEQRIFKEDQAQQAASMELSALRSASDLQSAETKNPGAWYTITAASEPGYNFFRWEGQTHNVENVNSQTTRIYMPAANVVLVAVYTPQQGPGPTPTAIPTMSEWGLIIMSVLMLITGAIMYRRREQGLM